MPGGVTVIIEAKLDVRDSASWDTLDKAIGRLGGTSAVNATVNATAAALEGQAAAAVAAANAMSPGESDDDESTHGKHTAYSQTIQHSFHAAQPRGVKQCGVYSVGLYACKTAQMLSKFLYTAHLHHLQMMNLTLPCKWCSSRRRVTQGEEGWPAAAAAQLCGQAHAQPG